MWRQPRHACLRPFGLWRATCATKGVSGDPPQAHPILFDAPVVPRAIGRDTELLQLWQNLLSGRRRQAIIGPDGIGKSTIAAEFCNRARRSERFTCIRWFNAQDSVKCRLMDFFHSVKERKEKNILLVMDGVHDIMKTFQLVPDHPNLYTLLTSNAEIEGNESFAVLKTPPLSECVLAQFTRLSESESSLRFVEEVFRSLGYVPLLMHIAACLMEGETISPETLLHVLRDKGVGAGETLSISHAINVLMDASLASLEATHPGGTEHVEAFAFFNLDNIPYTAVDLIVGEGAGEQFAALLSGLGICTQRWEEPSLSIHPCVATFLQSRADSSALLKSAAVLQSLWPRRWRGTSSTVVYELVEHTRAILSSFDSRKIPVNDDLLMSLDRSATFLAINEGKELGRAAEFWVRAIEANRRDNKQTTEAVRMGRECGRLLHYLRDSRAADVLQYSFELAGNVHGKQSPEAALILGCYAPYLPASPATLQQLNDGVGVLEACISSVDTVLGKEEGRMLLQTVFVLLVCQGQVLQELGDTVPQSLWVAIRNVEERIKSGKWERS
ncbi:putative NADH ubiquinone oxidoreductase complex I subunit [Trypanosoma vivax]|uniref:AAA+ ATPase domain-containing protein n=1 Tax=Trypanosoma vivax (strain Y486) TaxID=1055687 RepID=G0TR04_TRYVY|nr:hypothetical protein TRVL_04609 [Trypanosoma vivax]KAH8611312.1 putative NADH ubiquinone oxidoreductase complex I subunit [Trypanosoma vivax]CCC46368.1 conserved hypothetical protein [Trypanosoma vivax Y486]